MTTMTLTKTTTAVTNLPISSVHGLFHPSCPLLLHRPQRSAMERPNPKPLHYTPPLHPPPPPPRPPLQLPMFLPFSPLVPRPILFRRLLGVMTPQIALHHHHHRRHHPLPRSHATRKRRSFGAFACSSSMTHSATARHSLLLLLLVLCRDGVKGGRER